MANENPMRIYVSLPISGYDIDEVEAQAIFACGVIEKKGHIPINPLDTDREGMEYADFMGKDIPQILRADAVLFLNNWHKSKGCKLEFAAATIYDKQIYFDLSQIPPF